MRSTLGLSTRQGQIIERLFIGERLESVAQELGISHGTIKTYQQRIYHKLGVSDRGQMILAVAQAHLDVNIVPMVHAASA